MIKTLTFVKSAMVVLCIAALISCNTHSHNDVENAPQLKPVSEVKANINKQLEAWHNAAAEANYDAYFSSMSSDGVFIGTDASENWQNEAFRAFAKPYFDKGKAWSFSTLERNIYVGEYQDLAWFDELLDTQMGVCRGSGVLEKDSLDWKIKHYVLSIAIPNENVPEVTALKAEYDADLIEVLQKAE